jgi:hypothetical protein
VPYLKPTFATAVSTNPSKESEAFLPEFLVSRALKSFLFDTDSAILSRFLTR